MAEHDGDFAAVFADLAAILIEGQTIDSTLGRIGDLAVRGIKGCDDASVSLLADGKVTDAAFTSDLARAGDEEQYRTGQGPCLTSIADREVVVMPATADEVRWLDWLPWASQSGVGSVLSLPLTADGSVGALNLYSQRPRGFAEDTTLATRFAAQAGIALANANIHARAIALADQLKEALESRAVIDQAKGILMERQGCDADEAFAILRTASQKLNRKLRDVAQQLVESAHGESPS